MEDNSHSESQPHAASVAVVWAALRDWYDDLVGVIVINMLWALSWLTIVLGPPATFGVYQYAHYIAHGSNEGVSGLWEGMKRYFIKSWLAFALFLIGDIVIGVNIIFYWKINTLWSAGIGGLFIFLLILWLVTWFYALAYLFEQETPSLKMALKNGLFTIFAAPGYTFVVAGLAFSLIAISLALIIPLLFGLPVLVAMIATRSVRDRLDVYGVREREQSAH